MSQALSSLLIELARALQMDVDDAARIELIRKILEEVVVRFDAEQKMLQLEGHPSASQWEMVERRLVERGMDSNMIRVLAADPSVQGSQAMRVTVGMMISGAKALLGALDGAMITPSPFPASQPVVHAIQAPDNPWATIPQTEIAPPLTTGVLIGEVMSQPIALQEMELPTERGPHAEEYEMAEAKAYLKELMDFDGDTGVWAELMRNAMLFEADERAMMLEGLCAASKEPVTEEVFRSWAFNVTNLPREVQPNAHQRNICLKQAMAVCVLRIIRHHGLDLQNWCTIMQGVNAILRLETLEGMLLDVGVEYRDFVTWIRTNYNDQNVSLSQKPTIHVQRKLKQGAHELLTKTIRTALW